MEESSYLLCLFHKLNILPLVLLLPLDPVLLSYKEDCLFCLSSGQVLPQDGVRFPPEHPVADVDIAETFGEILNLNVVFSFKI